MAARLAGDVANLRHEMTDAIPAQSVVWDDHRNTSQVFPVPPGAVEDALAAMERLRRDDPALVRWLMDRHPTLTEAEHLERFGAPYKKRPKRAR